MRIHRTFWLGCGSVNCRTSISYGWDWNENVRGSGWCRAYKYWIPYNCFQEPTPHPPQGGATVWQCPQSSYFPVPWALGAHYGDLPNWAEFTTVLGKWVEPALQVSTQWETILRHPTPDIWYLPNVTATRILKNKIIGSTQGKIDVLNVAKPWEMVSKECIILIWSGEQQFEHIKRIPLKPLMLDWKGLLDCKSCVSCFLFPFAISTVCIYLLEKLLGVCIDVPPSLDYNLFEISLTSRPQHFLAKVMYHESKGRVRTA